MIRLLADGSFDLVFVESGRDRHRDVWEWLPKLRPGGFLGGHDLRITHPRDEYHRTILAQVAAPRKQNEEEETEQKCIFCLDRRDCRVAS